MGTERTHPIGKIHFAPTAAQVQKIEALHQIGVSLAASFDIDSILQQIAVAAGDLMGESSIDVYYGGYPAINARSRWFPQGPTCANLSSESRRRIEEILAGSGGEKDDSRSPWVLAEKALSGLPDGAGRDLIPIASPPDELLGLMIVKPPATMDTVKRGILPVLALQAATALRNIHLTQERIHFERLAAFGRMIGSLVHDLRSPLTAIRGYAGMLGGPNLTGHEREEFSRLAKEECDRLNSMINDLLEFTRGGRSQLRWRRMPLGDYLKELRPTIQAHFGASGVRFEMELAYEGPLLMDPDRMSRAVLNMVSNAKQAMNGDGVFTVRSERTGSQVILEFEDTGCGIPDEILHRIFEPFFSYGKAQGIGLGMSITKKIVEEHGGKVHINSQVGRGTRIQFLLPLETAFDSSSESLREDAVSKPVEAPS